MGPADVNRSITATASSNAAPAGSGAAQLRRRRSATQRAAAPGAWDPASEEPPWTASPTGLAPHSCASSAGTSASACTGVPSRIRGPPPGAPRAAGGQRYDNGRGIRCHVLAVARNGATKPPVSFSSDTTCRLTGSHTPYRGSEPHPRCSAPTNPGWREDPSALQHGLGQSGRFAAHALHWLDSPVVRFLTTMITHGLLLVFFRAGKATTVDPSATPNAGVVREDRVVKNRGRSACPTRRPLPSPNVSIDRLPGCLGTQPGQVDPPAV